EGEEVTVFAPVLIGVERLGAPGLDQCGVAGRGEDSICGAEGCPAGGCVALLASFEPDAGPGAAAEHVAAVASCDWPGRTIHLQQSVRAGPCGLDVCVAQ